MCKTILSDLVCWARQVLNEGLEVVSMVKGFWAVCDNVGVWIPATFTYTHLSPEVPVYACTYVPMYPGMYSVPEQDLGNQCHTHHTYLSPNTGNTGSSKRECLVEAIGRLINIVTRYLLQCRYLGRYLGRYVLADRNPIFMPTIYT